METKKLSLEEMGGVEGGFCWGAAFAYAGIIIAAASPVTWAVAAGAAISMASLIHSAVQCEK